jgi:hypothetical protein
MVRNATFNTISISRAVSFSTSITGLVYKVYLKLIVYTTFNIQHEPGFIAKTNSYTYILMLSQDNLIR